MIGRDSREDMDAYGVWPWLGGIAIAMFLIWIMFKFAAPISG